MISQSCDFAIGSDERLQRTLISTSPDQPIPSLIPKRNHRFHLGRTARRNVAGQRRYERFMIARSVTSNHEITKPGVTKSTELGFHFTRSPDGPITRFLS